MVLDPDTLIVFQHIPKCGGTSLIRLFEQIFGEDLCYRHKARNGKTGEISPPVKKLDREHLLRLRFLAGHFREGAPVWIEDIRPVKYITVLRDPVDRLISDWYYNKDRGNQRNREIASTLSLNEYFCLKIGQPWSTMSHNGQCQFIVGDRNASFESALAEINRSYLAITSIEMLDSFQQDLARQFGYPDLAPLRSNQTTSNEDRSDELRDDVRQLFISQNVEDYRLLEWTREMKPPIALETNIHI